MQIQYSYDFQKMGYRLNQEWGTFSKVKPTLVASTSHEDRKQQVYMLLFKSYIATISAPDVGIMLSTRTLSGSRGFDPRLGHHVLYIFQVSLKGVTKMQLLLTFTCIICRKMKNRLQRINGKI